jgi:GAF domain-containing protein
MTEQGAGTMSNDEVGALKQLLTVATRLNSTLNIQELLQLIISTTAELVGAEEGSLLLVDDRRAGLQRLERRDGQTG